MIVLLNQTFDNTKINFTGYLNIYVSIEPWKLTIQPTDNIIVTPRRGENFNIDERIDS